MPAGRLPKRTWNTTGLRNRGCKISEQGLPTGNTSQNSEKLMSDDDWQLKTYFDSTRPIIDDKLGLDTDSDVEEVPEWEDIGDKDLQGHLVDMAREQGDDPTDEDWLPLKLLKKKRKLKQDQTSMYFAVLGLTTR